MVEEKRRGYEAKKKRVRYLTEYHKKTEIDLRKVISYKMMKKILIDELDELKKKIKKLKNFRDYRQESCLYNLESRRCAISLQIQIIDLILNDIKIFNGDFITIILPFTPKKHLPDSGFPYEFPPIRNGKLSVKIFISLKTPIEYVIRLIQKMDPLKRNFKLRFNPILAIDFGTLTYHGVKQVPPHATAIC